MEKVKAFYFARPDLRLGYGDNRKVELFTTHTVDCTPEMCIQGLHGSVRALDALSYAKSPRLFGVEISGSIDKGTNKLCGKFRKYVKDYGDITQVLQAFARKQALGVVHLLKRVEGYDTIKEFLETGDEALRSTAQAAAQAVAQAAPRDATWDAAWAANWATTRAAARGAAGDAAWATTRATARAAALDAARATTRGADQAAAWGAASDMLEQLLEDHYKTLRV